MFYRNRKTDELDLAGFDNKIKDNLIIALENETLLASLERAGIKSPSRCKSGSCGFCHSRLIKGEYYVDPKHESRRSADFKFGYIHPCATYPCSDMEIDVPPLNLGGNK